MGVLRGTLQDYLKKVEQLNIPPQSLDLSFFTPGYNTKQIFTDEQEEGLETYLKTIADMHFGCTLLEARKLAYNYAITKGIKLPDNWKCKASGGGGIAGEDWYRGFMARHKTLSVRTPEGTSLGRATAFNRHNVGTFFDNLEQVLDKHNTGNHHD
jgi:hypothetical protein